MTEALQKMIDTKSEILNCILICRADVSMPLLFAHLPTMAYLAGNKVKIAPLASGSLADLKFILGEDMPLCIGIKVLILLNLGWI